MLEQHKCVPIKSPLLNKSIRLLFVRPVVPCRACSSACVQVHMREFVCDDARGAGIRHLIEPAGAKLQETASIRYASNVDVGFMP